MRLSPAFFVSAALGFASAGCAAQSGTGPTTSPSPVASAAVQPAAAAVPAAADKVYPPLPTLAMLPPPGSDDDDDTAPVTHHTTKHGKKSRHLDCHCTAPSPHLVVSDESRAYLQTVERQLDVALAR
jgi:hypothetical protein